MSGNVDSRLKSATIDDTINYLIGTEVKIDDPYLLPGFFTSIPFFSTNEEIITKFELRTNHAIGSYTVEEVNLRIADLIRTWILHCPSDFAANAPLRGRLEMFTRNAFERTSPKLTTFFNGTLKKIDSKPGLPELINPDASRQRKTVSTESLGNQITLYESECFKLIEPAAFVRRTQALTDYNNSADMVSNWAISYVVSQASVGKAAKAITFLCHLCERLEENGNYRGVAEIVAGLNHSTVYRLKPAWEKVPKNLVELVNALSARMTNTNNFKEYREFLQTRTPPFIPFVGVFLTDLTFAMENKMFCDPQKTLINFERLRLVGRILSNIEHFQRSTYNFKQDFSLIAAIYNRERCDERTLLVKSDALVPLSESKKFLLTAEASSPSPTKEYEATQSLGDTASGDRPPARVSPLPPVMAHSKSSTAPLPLGFSEQYQSSRQELSYKAEVKSVTWSSYSEPFVSASGLRSNCPPEDELKETSVPSNDSSQTVPRALPRSSSSTSGIAQHSSSSMNAYNYCLPQAPNVTSTQQFHQRYDSAQQTLNLNSSSTTTYQQHQQCQQYQQRYQPQQPQQPTCQMRQQQQCQVKQVSPDLFSNTQRQNSNRLEPLVPARPNRPIRQNYSSNQQINNQQQQQQQSLPPPRQQQQSFKSSFPSQQSQRQYHNLTPPVPARNLSLFQESATFSSHHDYESQPPSRPQPAIPFAANAPRSPQQQNGNHLAQQQMLSSQNVLEQKGFSYEQRPPRYGY